MLSIADNEMFKNHLSRCTYRYHIYSFISERIRGSKELSFPLSDFVFYKPLLERSDDESVVWAVGDLIDLMDGLGDEHLSFSPGFINKYNGVKYDSGLAIQFLQKSSKYGWEVYISRDFADFLIFERLVYEYNLDILVPSFHLKGNYSDPDIRESLVVLDLSNLLSQLYLFKTFKTDILNFVETIEYYCENVSLERTSEIEQIFLGKIDDSKFKFNLNMDRDYDKVMKLLSFILDGNITSSKTEKSIFGLFNIMESQLVDTLLTDPLYQNKTIQEVLQKLLAIKLMFSESSVNV